MASSPPRLLVAASGTGGHLFPAIALAELSDYKIEWLGTTNRLETSFVPRDFSRSLVCKHSKLLLA